MYCIVMYCTVLYGCRYCVKNLATCHKTALFHVGIYQRSTRYQSMYIFVYIYTEGLQEPQLVWMVIQLHMRNLKCNQVIILRVLSHSSMKSRVCARSYYCYLLLSAVFIAWFVRYLLLYLFVYLSMYLCIA